MRSKLALLFLLICIVGRSQSGSPAFVKSTLVIISEDKNGHSEKYPTENAYMILNTSTGDFILNADLSVLRTGNKIQDSLIKSNGEQMLSFKGNINENLAFFNQQQNDERMYPMPGNLVLNGYSVSCIAQFDPINAAEKSESKNYRMDFALSVDASKIVIKGLENSFAKQVVFEIVGGKLNIQ